MFSLCCFGLFLARNSARPTHIGGNPITVRSNCGQKEKIMITVVKANEKTKVAKRPDPKFVSIKQIRSLANSATCRVNTATSFGPICKADTNCR